MHILIVNSHLLDVPGGSETQCHEIATRLMALGHKVTYAICRPGRHSYDVPYPTYPLRGPLPSALAAALTELAPDVVYWRRNKRYLLRSMLATRFRRIKFVFAVSAIRDLRAFTRRRYLDERVSLIRRALRMLAMIGDAAKDSANYLAVLLADGIVFQHPGQLPRDFHGCYEIVFNSYPPVVVKPETSDAPYVLWVGNLKKVKNPEYFLRLASDLLHTGVEFWMAGGIQDPAYQRLVDDEASLPPNFRHLGLQSQDAINSLMSGSLFVVSTSTEEGFPNVFVHAWLQRKCVVSLHVDLGGILVTEQIGLCSGNYAAFKGDVSRLIADPELRNTMGERAFQFAVANCNPETNVRRLERFLVRVVSDQD